MVEVIPQLGTAVSGAGLPWRGRGRAGAAGPALLRPSVPRGGRPENGSWKTGLLFSGRGESDLAPPWRRGGAGLSPRREGSCRFRPEPVWRGGISAPDSGSGWEVLVLARAPLQSFQSASPADWTELQPTNAASPAVAEGSRGLPGEGPLLSPQSPCKDTPEAQGRRAVRLDLLPGPRAPLYSGSWVGEGWVPAP